MDMDEDDAFLYGDDSAPQASAGFAQGATSVANGQAKAEDAGQAANELSASMAASLAAYGIDPGAAVKQPLENPEDGGVEEEDPEDDDSDDSDEDDVKFVFTGNSRSLDLRKSQQSQQQSSVVGIGKWAHASTGAQQAAAQNTSTGAAYITGVSNRGSQTTEYVPASRPSATPQPPTQVEVNPLSNPPITLSSSQPVNLQPQPQTQGQTSPNTAQPQNGPPVNPNLPPSNFPPVYSNNKINPEHPSGIIPSSGASVYEIDSAMFEGSGQPWRQPGAVLSDYFNFGFDENTYPRFLRYRAEMEQGVKQLASLPQMAGIPDHVQQMLHIQNTQQMGMNPMAMQGMAGMGGMGAGIGMNQMQAQMAQIQQMMAMGGMDMAIIQGMQDQNNMGNIGGMGNTALRQQQVRVTQTPQPQPSSTPAVTNPILPSTAQTQGSASTPQAGTVGDIEVKQEEGEHSESTPTPSNNINTQGQIPKAPSGPRAGGAAAARGGRGGAVPLGPRAVVSGAVGVPNAPKGPKAGRFKDVDRVDQSGAGSLDYGDDDEKEKTPKKKDSRERSREQDRGGEGDRSKGSRKEKERGEYDEHEEGYISEDRDKERERRKRKEKERERSDRGDRERSDKAEKEKDRAKRKGSAALGPDGWEDEEEDERRSSRRKRSPSEESDHPRRSKRR
ncbi:uncharacterized protein L203_102242 [Cryptococcus depauperatus CBS 7841]|uniref:Pre-mRNA polyadenylation factor Fip1 domain-containing protein n=1 Tax=Cryptococcus depauperatus CBS 7841 TaxID=1295531 RepID=A0AAJ8JRH1_9TREE